MSKFVQWLLRSIKNPSGSSTTTKEVVRRGTTNYVILRIATTGSPPSAVNINNLPVSVTAITSAEHFDKLETDAGVDLPSDSTGATIEAYSNSTKKEVIVFGLGGSLRQRYGLNKDNI